MQLDMIILRCGTLDFQGRAIAATIGDDALGLLFQLELSSLYFAKFLFLGVKARGNGSDGSL